MVSESSKTTKIIPFRFRVALLDHVQLAQTILFVVHRVRLLDHVDQMVLDDQLLHRYEVRVLQILNVDRAPRVLSQTTTSAILVDADLIGRDDCEWQKRLVEIVLVSFVFVEIQLVTEIRKIIDFDVVFLYVIKYLRGSERYEE